MVNKIINYLRVRYQHIQGFIIRNFMNNSSKLKCEYIDWLFDRNKNFSKDYIPFEKFDSKKTYQSKLIAYYLPQYYANEVNDENFGKGFMEWYNVTKTIPQYVGHNQPQLPVDVGFYDLTHDDIMFRQIELAKNYGIYGFCFYYYWFSGERLLDKPLDNFLVNKNLKMPFCLFWANETWTHLWGNGDHKKIIKEQKLLDSDYDLFLKDILKYFDDERYIKINNKPVLIIYKMLNFEKNNFMNFIKYLRENIQKYGYDDVYLITTDANYESFDIDDFNIDAMVEFNHTKIMRESPLFDVSKKYVNPSFKARILDVSKALKNNLHLSNLKNVYRCVCAGWDNSARKAYSIGSTVLQMSISDYKKWLKDSIIWTHNNKNSDEQFIFIDSWNEWAEGAHLEPDQTYGYGYLQATKDVLEDVSEKI